MRIFSCGGQIADGGIITGKRRARVTKVGRFQVMATLQAARAKVLGMRVKEAKSWGLNRAIFYAAAKRGFKSLGGGKVALKLEVAEGKRSEIEKTLGTEYLGGEYAYRVKIDGRSVFTIGEKVQTEEDFKQKIESRFGGRFKEAWEEALRICRSYDREVLESQKDFFGKVYKPRRDELARDWTRVAEGE
jgi:hypothetical protein